MAKEMTQEEREKFFEEPKGMLGKAVSDEKWDMAMGHYVGPFNENMTLKELREYVESKKRVTTIKASPDYFTITDIWYAEGDDGGES